MIWEQRTPKYAVNPIDSVIQQLANIRGIDNIKDFLNPSMHSEHDPYLLLNIKHAADCILTAIVKGQRICISADCDSDGLFSTAVMARYLRQFTDNYYVIYAERSEGHGIEYQQHKIQLDTTDLLIILDSSSNSTYACKSIAYHGITIIILDHHAIEEQNPYAIIVNPQLDDYPNKEISGATLAYKMIEVLDDSLGSGTVDDYLDLVACGMYADMMDVSVPENRSLIIRGMKQILNPGLRALIAVKRIDPKKINCQTIGYTISPLINGVARMDQIEIALDLLLEDDMDRCISLASKMITINEDRKKIQRQLFKAYSEQIDTTGKIIIAIDDNASKGFNGVIANDLAHAYQRPAMVMRRTNGLLTGSYRTFGKFKLKSFLNKFPMIEYARGHEEAGGISLKEIHLDSFMEYVDRKIGAHMFAQKLEYDIIFNASEINEEIVSEIQQFDYLTGKGMEQAKFLVTDVFVEGRQVMGKNRDTVKLICDDIEAIKFKTTEDWAQDVDTLDTITIVGSLSINEWFKRGTGLIVTNQIIIDDLITQ